MNLKQRRHPPKNRKPLIHFREGTMEDFEKHKVEANFLKEKFTARLTSTIGSSDGDNPPLDVSRYTYRLPLGVEGDEHWFIEADAARPDALEQYKEGCLYLDKPHPSTEDMVIGARWIQLSAAQGNPMAQLALANCHMNYVGFEYKGNEEAAYWYLIGAERGCAESQFALSALYRSGVSIPVDEVESLRYLRLAAAQDHPKAMCELGRHYLHGNGMAVDVAQAVLMFQQAATHDVSDALANLGQCYESGIGMPKDLGKALEHYQLAAKQEQAFACNKLGLFYLGGTVFPKDDVLAARMFAVAANGHFKAAYANLGRCYLLGIGVPKDEEMAVRLLSIASISFIREAQILLGKCHRHGLGVGKCDSTAIHIMQMAESNPTITEDLIPDFTSGVPANADAQFPEFGTLNVSQHKEDSHPHHPEHGRD